MSGNTIDESTGKTLWARVLGDKPTCVSANNGQVLVGSSGGKVFAYSYSGSPIFTASLTSSAITGLAASSSQWLVSQSDKITSLQPDGTTAWTGGLSAPLAGGNVAIEGNTVYAARRIRN